MGAPMARRLQEAGYELTVCDRSSDAVAAFAGPGVRIARTPSECAGSDLVLVLVATPAQVQAVVVGEDGIVAGVRHGRLPVVAVMSTTGPDAMQDLARATAHRGVRLLDAPVSGGPLRAERGRLSIMVGGDAGDVDAARPAFDVLAAHVFHCGPVGAAQTVKIVNNIIGVTNAFVGAEAYRIALDRGVRLADATPVLEASSGRSYLSADADDAVAFYARSAATRQEFAQLSSIMLKDLGVALEMVSASAGSYPVLAGVVATLGSLGDETFDNWRAVGRSGTPEVPTAF